MRNRLAFIVVAIACLAALVCGAGSAQQATPGDIWRMVPPDSLAVAAFDGRPENASIRAIEAAQDQETLDRWAAQQADMRKAVENLATLFGVSLDFAKDIDPWSGRQWAFALVPQDGSVAPVCLMASKDASAADAALQKMLSPWQRVGQIAPQPDTDYPITAFLEKRSGIELYASAHANVVAFSPSKDALRSALKGGGFAAGSPAAQTLDALAGSMFYVFASPALAQVLGESNAQFPFDGVGLGVSAEQTGVSMRVVGLPNKAAGTLFKQVLANQQPGVLMTNSGVPSTALIATSLPNLATVSAFAAMVKIPHDPVLALVGELGDVQVSGAMTAALPIPAGVLSMEAASEQAATEKMAKIADAIKKMRLKTLPPVTQCGVQATPILVEGLTMHLAQVGKYVLLASDMQSFGDAVAAAKGDKPALGQSIRYTETMSGLGASNLLTVYGNLAPVQGIGFLLQGLGLGQLDPYCNALAKSLENAQAMGLGLGYDGTFLSANIFLRAKPGIGPSIGPVVIGGTAVSAAVLFPVFARAKASAHVATCEGNLKELAIAMQCYAADHDGKLPSAASWRRELEEYTDAEYLECPGGNSSYAFNKNLGGVNLNKILEPSNVVMFFEARPGVTSGSRADAILPHYGMGNFAFADTHVRKMSGAPPQSQWVPKMQAPKPSKAAPVKKAPVKKAPAKTKRK